MKKLMLITGWLFCFACNNTINTGEEVAPPNDTDLNSNNTDKPTPGLGNDPTRNDARKENPLSGHQDSASQKNDARATPGLGNDPTRNNESNTNSPSIQKND